MAHILLKKFLIFSIFFILVSVFVLNLDFSFASLPSDFGSSTLLTDFGSSTLLTTFGSSTLLTTFGSSTLLTTFGLNEGDLISAIFSDDPDVYIINEHGYKRLFLNPEIFKFYSHLGGFTNVKLVTSEVRDSFPTTGLFRNCEDKDPRVFGIDVEGEDQGQLHWVNTTGDQAVKDDPDFFKKVFCINKKEFNWYKKASEFNSITEVPKYDRIIETAVVSTKERLESKAETKNIGKVIICHYPPENIKAYQTLTIDASALKAHLDHGDTVGACLSPTSTPTPTPTPVATSSPQATPSTSSGPTVPPSASPTSSVSFSPTPTVTPSVTPIPTTTASPIPVPTSTTSPTPTPTPTLTSSPSPSPTVSVSATPIPTPTPTPTPTLILTPTQKSFVANLYWVKDVRNKSLKYAFSIKMDGEVYTPKTFNVYLKIPNDSAFKKYTTLSIQQYQGIYRYYDEYYCKNWKISCNNSYTDWRNEPPILSLTNVNDGPQHLGQYQYYATEVYSDGTESMPSPTRTATVYSAPTIENPANGSTIAPQSLRVTVKNTSPVSYSYYREVLWQNNGQNIFDKTLYASDSTFYVLELTESGSPFRLAVGLRDSQPVRDETQIAESTFYVVSPTPTPTPTPTVTVTTASVGFDNFSRNLANAAKITRDLYQGTTGNDVKQLQALLVNEVNYPADLVTGYFGRITREAVKKLQEKYGVKPVSGYFGEITRKALKALISN